jgi:hydrogenase nickel incorporation protein HypA/HybF
MYRLGRIGGVIHELSVTNAVLEIALDHAARVQGRKVNRVRSIKLKVGCMRDVVDEYMQQYFTYISRGTLAEGASLSIEHVPIVFACDACGATYSVGFLQLGEEKCSGCGGDQATLISGREFSVEGIEVVCDGSN